MGRSEGSYVGEFFFVIYGVNGAFIERRKKSEYSSCE